MRTTDLARRMDAVEHHMDTIEERLDASYALLSTQILQSRRETNDAILALRTDLAGDIAASRDELRGELRGEIAALRTDMLDRFAKLETALAEGLEETRRFMKILYEDILSRISLLGEVRPR